MAIVFLQHKAKWVLACDTFPGQNKMNSLVKKTFRNQQSNSNQMKQAEEREREREREREEKALVLWEDLQ
jgi:hypothetical protein